MNPLSNKNHHLGLSLLSSPKGVAIAGLFGKTLLLAALLLLCSCAPAEPPPKVQQSRNATPAAAPPSQDQEEAGEKFSPFAGTISLNHDTTSANLSHGGPTALDGMSREQIADFRLKKVHELTMLGIFPPSYRPFEGPGARIYRDITPGASWLGPTAYYVANPYQLIILTCANHVTPLNLFCPNVEITYRGGRFEETRRGASARCWFDTLYGPNYADHPGELRVIMVNAYDAGFVYAHVDLAASTNIDADPNPTNIARGPYNQSCFYHVGRYGANNISPEDHDGWLKLRERGAPTRIVVKLWRHKPQSLQQTADLTYEIQVGPTS